MAALGSPVRTQGREGARVHGADEVAQSRMEVFEFGGADPAADLRLQVAQNAARRPQVLRSGRRERRLQPIADSSALRSGGSPTASAETLYSEPNSRTALVIHSHTRKTMTPPSVP